MAGRHTYRTKAIVLGRTKLSEQDLILTLLSETGGQVRAVAKGARKPGGRLAARTELFCETDFLLATGRSLDIVCEAAVLSPHSSLRGSLERVGAASAVMEVARLTCYEDTADPFLYPVCARALLACEQAPDQPRLDLVVAAYVLKVVAHGGWRPQLESCVGCGDGDVSYLCVSAGGTLCASCAKDVAGIEEVGTAQLFWISFLIGSTFDQVVSARMDSDPQWGSPSSIREAKDRPNGRRPSGGGSMVNTASWLVGFAHRWAATHLESRLRALEFYLSM